MYIDLYGQPSSSSRPKATLSLFARLSYASSDLSDEPNEVRHFMLSMGNIIDYTRFVYHRLTVKEKQEYMHCISHRFDCLREVNGLNNSRR